MSYEVFDNPKLFAEAMLARIKQAGFTEADLAGMRSVHYPAHALFFPHMKYLFQLLVCCLMGLIIGAAFAYYF